MEDAANFAKMKVADLKKELKNKGLAVTGNKNELVERLLAAEGHAPLEAVEGEEEEFDEEEILGGEMDAAEISKLTPQEEEAALTGANVKVKKAAALVQKTPSKKNGKLNLKRSEPTPEVPVTKASPKKPVSVEDDSKEEKEQENIEPPKKTVKIDEDDGEKTAYEKRAERFGIPMTEEAKKLARAARFGELTNGAVKGSSKLSKETGGVNIEKLKARAERFGETTSKSLTKVEELEKKKTRQDRFGDATAKAEKAETPAVDAAKAARAARFAAAEKKEEAKPEEKAAEVVVAQ